MTYTWEKESLQKYGEEVTSQLIQEQQKYEEKHKDNDCKGCGNKNQGSIMDNEGKPFIMHYGMWSYSKGVHKCGYCGKKTVSKQKKVVEVVDIANIKPTTKQVESIKSMLKSYGKGESKTETLKKLGWYDLASGIKNIELTRKIMTDLNVI